MGAMETFTPGPRPTNRSELVTWYTSILKEQERSGLSMADFADTIGAHVVTLYSWKRRLGAPAVPASDSPRGLVEVRVRDHSPLVVTPSPIILRLGHERTLEVPLNFDGSELQRLVTALESC